MFLNSNLEIYEKFRLHPNDDSLIRWILLIPFGVILVPFTLVIHGLSKAYPPQLLFTVGICYFVYKTPNAAILGIF
jgi:hypothetical protein